MRENLINSDLLKYMENVKDFEGNLDDISKTWDQLIFLSQLGSSSINMSDTKTNFNSLTTELINHLAHETLKKVLNEMNSKASVAVDIVIRNLFERTADIGFLATDDDIRSFLIDAPIGNDNIKSNIIERFREYVAKYSVYYDIVLFNTKGEIVVKLDESNNVEKTTDDIIEKAKSTTEDYVETYRYHDFLPKHEKSLVYTYKVTKTNDSDEIIGYLSLCFKFEDEMEGVFSNLICKENKETILLLDSDNVSIASSDKYHIPIGAKLDVELTKDFSITQFAGRDYIIKTCKTNGYEGFYGLGWMGHIMIPLDSVFKNYSQDVKIESEILTAMMQNDELFEKELLAIPAKAQLIQDELDRAVWNGNVSQMDGDQSGVNFARSILREVRQTGEKTKRTFNTSIEKLNETIITSLLENVVFLASLSIDIMDRNLYERANDCRWWALTSTFKEILAKENLNSEDKQNLTDILKYINELYTVYTNLFIYDTNGVIIAVSNEKEKKLVGTKVSDDWVKESLNLKDSSKYSVSSFDKTSLYDNEETYIYAASITDDKSHVVGGIAVVFDSTPQFKDMLIDALPSENDEVKKGKFSLFVEKENKKIVSCSDDSHIVGEILAIDNEFFTLNEGETKSKIVQYNDKYYIVGVKCSKGYREYKSHSDDYVNDILSFVFIEAGDINNNSSVKNQIENQYYNYPINPNDEIVEIATFYIGDKWLGVKQSEIVEAISMKSLESPISMDSEHHFKGTVSYKKYIVSVLDISKFIKNIDKSEKNDIVLVRYKGSVGEHTVGIAVNKLGEIMKVPKENIVQFDQHLIGGGMLGESIVQPPKDVTAKSLLTLLNISKIGEINE